MYVELTPDDTLRDLQSLLIDALPKFEFPRFNINSYTIDVVVKKESEITDGDFVLGVVWHNLDNSEIFEDILDGGDNEVDKYISVDNSSFAAELTSEEINILAILMMIGWVQRQVTSIENTRMKYSGSDFKMTSQANHLQKLMGLLTECKAQSHHMQRLYKRRRIINGTGTDYDGMIRSNWDVLGKGVYYDRYSY